jgi:hypothetical protein
MNDVKGKVAIGVADGNVRDQKFVPFAGERIADTTRYVNGFGGVNGAVVADFTRGMDPGGQTEVAEEDFVGEAEQNGRMGIIRIEGVGISERRKQAGLGLCQIFREAAQLESRADKLRRRGRPDDGQGCFQQGSWSGIGVETRFSGGASGVHTDCAVRPGGGANDDLLSFIERLLEARAHPSLLEPYVAEVGHYGDGHVAINIHTGDEAAAKSKLAGNLIAVNSILVTGGRVYRLHAVFGKGHHLLVKAYPTQPLV